MAANAYRSLSPKNVGATRHQYCVDQEGGSRPCTGDEATNSSISIGESRGVIDKTVRC